MSIVQKLITVVLVLCIGVLLCILFNGIHRCYYNFAKAEGEDDVLYVDLYSENLESIPSDASEDMTVLIDLGVHNLETGIYKIRTKPLPPIKMAMPEVGTVYRILCGQYAGLCHTIRMSFLEIKPPSETQIFTNDNLNLVLQSDTRFIHVLPTVLLDCTLDLGSHWEVGKIYTLDIRHLSNSQLRFVSSLRMGSDRSLGVTSDIKGPFIGSICFYKEDPTTLAIFHV
jgi:hypothetical protein